MERLYGLFRKPLTMHLLLLLNQLSMHDGFIIQIVAQLDARIVVGALRNVGVQRDALNVVLICEWRLTIPSGPTKDSGQLGRAGRYFEALHFYQICYLIVSGYAGRAGDGAGGDSSAAPRQEATLKSCLKASGFLGVSDTGAPITRAGVSKAG